jgi:hypothetical protein
VTKSGVANTSLPGTAIATTTFNILTASSTAGKCP